MRGRVTAEEGYFFDARRRRVFYYGGPPDNHELFSLDATSPAPRWAKHAIGGAAGRLPLSSREVVYVPRQDVFLMAAKASAYESTALEDLIWVVESDRSTFRRLKLAKGAGVVIQTAGSVSEGLQYDPVSDLCYFIQVSNGVPQMIAFRYEPGAVPPAPPAVTTQPASQTVTAGQAATFSVAATGTAPLAYQWQRNGTDIAAATSSSYTTPSTTAADSGASFRVVVSNAAGSVTSNAATLTVTAPPANPDTDGDGLPDAWERQHFGNLNHGPDGDPDGDGATNRQEQQGGTDPMDPASRPVGALPPPWVHRDLGVVGAEGTATYAAGTFTIRGAGADIGGAADAFHFVYQPWSGDGQITARVASLQATHPGAKAGVMIRESLTSESRHAFATLTPAGGTLLQWRPQTNGPTQATSGQPSPVPSWVRLVRRGDLFTAYGSPDGSNWTVLGSETILMGVNGFVGLAVTAHAAGNLSTSTFDQVAVTAVPDAGPGEPPPGRPSDDPEPAGRKEHANGDSGCFGRVAAGGTAPWTAFLFALAGGAAFAARRRRRRP